MEVIENLEKVFSQNVDSKNTVKAQSMFLATGMLQRIGFFEKSIPNQRTALTIIINMLVDLKTNHDTEFSSNFRLYFLCKFLKYTIEVVRSHLIDEELALVPPIDAVNF